MALENQPQFEVEVDSFDYISVSYELFTDSLKIHVQKRLNEGYTLISTLTNAFIFARPKPIKEASSYVHNPVSQPRKEKE